MSCREPHGPASSCRRAGARRTGAYRPRSPEEAPAAAVPGPQSAHLCRGQGDGGKHRTTQQEPRRLGAGEAPLGYCVSDSRPQMGTESLPPEALGAGWTHHIPLRGTMPGTGMPAVTLTVLLGTKKWALCSTGGEARSP